MPYKDPTKRYENRQKYLATHISIYKKRNDAGLCRQCESPIQKGASCVSCRRIAADLKKAERENFLKNGICYRCKGKLTGSRMTCQCCLAKIARQTKEIRRAVVMWLGGECAKCGISQIGFLTIHHIQNDGKSDRKLFNNWIRYLYKMTAEQPPLERLQILCANCHLARGLNTHTRSSKDIRNRWLKIVIHFGGKCYCCGEKDPLKLTLDHINNDGYNERRTDISLAKRTWRRIKVGEDISNLRLACFNCNLGRAWNNGQCPHCVYR